MSRERKITSGTGEPAQKVYTGTSKFDALLICFYTVRKEDSHTNMGTAFMFYACESATTAMFLTITQKAV